jgi:flavin-dependent dehydrogenase
MCGRALLRRDLDWALVRQAVGAGARFESDVAVRQPLEAGSGASRSVVGVVAGVKGRTREFRAPVTIAADGRRSAVAFALGLARHPVRPRRWAIGAYYENVQGLSSFGEMHIRPGRYIGVAPVPGGLTNVCLVRSFEKGVERAAPFFERLLTDELARDPWLRDRFSSARIASPPVALGPLAVDVSSACVPGLLLAGDAAGFIDPMTGDGLRFAIRGGTLAADAALEALAQGWSAGVAARLGARRQREFGAKWRFNRALRGLVAHPSLVHGGALAARVWPGVLGRLIRTAGDCHAAALH